MKAADGSISYDSGTRINSEYGLTAAHVTNLNGAISTIVAVGEGANYNSPTASVGVSSVLNNPNWNPIFRGQFYSSDESIIKFASPLAGNDLTIGAMTVGQTYTTIGYGIWGTASLGNQGQNGNRLAWDAPYISPGGAAFQSPQYAATEYGQTNATGLIYAGQSLGGDSGAGVFHTATGELDGINVGNLGNNSAPYSLLGSSIIYNLGNDTWLQDNTQITPEPAGLAMVFAAAGGILLRRRLNQSGRARFSAASSSASATPKTPTTNPPRSMLD